MATTARRGRPPANSRSRGNAAPPAKKATPARKAAPARAPKAAPAAKPVRARDVTQYADKTPTPYHKTLARWIVTEVGYDPNSAGSKREAFLMGVSIATASRPAFMESSFLEAWRAESGQNKRGPKPKDDAETVRKSNRQVVSDEEFEPADDEEYEDDEELEDDEDADEYDDEDDADDDEDDDDEFDDEEEEVEEAPKPAARRGRPPGKRAPAKAAKATATRRTRSTSTADDDDFMF